MTNKRTKKILFLCPYPINKAPSQRLKYEQYFPYFIENGWHIKVSPFVTEKFWKIIYKKGHFIEKTIFTICGYLYRLRDLFYIRKYDVIYVHLWVTPLGLPIFEWLTKKLAKKLIYDIDDMVFLGHSSEANKYIIKIKGTKKMIFLMKNSNHVITCTPYLDQFVRQYNEKTTDISSTINTNIYLPRIDYQLNDIPILGWSGSHSTSKYLKLLEPVFLELLKKEIPFQILIIGDENFHFSDIKIPYKAIPWNLETEVEDLKKIDIGLYPLPDEPWVYGKSGLKALQYMALGIPTIATAVGANFRIINDAENGFLIPINDLDLWEKIIIQLFNDKELREKIGKKGRKTVERYYSLEANKNKYLSILESMI
jgi:glycosyltransferase involved in cell wall biosynthesis